MTDFRKSVIYQVYPKSFYDTDGDGLGDIRGVTAKLDYIKELGADYIWLPPFFASPQNDNGYDVEDYRRIDPRYGTMEDFDEYYLHLFDVSQPDLNWDNPQVREEIKQIVRFWMEKGVKGIRQNAGYGHPLPQGNALHLPGRGAGDDQSGF